MTRWRLVADIGGTNLRIARAESDGTLRNEVSKPLDACAALEVELKNFAAKSEPRSLADVAIAAAGPPDPNRIILTNRNFIVDAGAIGRALGNVPVQLYNDLQAVALALPWLGDDAFAPLLKPERPLSGPRLVVNIGTGFGGALLVPVNGGWHAVACEPGHMTIRESGVLNTRIPASPLSIEDAISGMTINDGAASARIWQRERITPHAETFGPNDSRQFVTAFSSLLGEVCGNLVLACGAWGGDHLIGSVASQWCANADTGAFASAFRAKGPMSARMAHVAVSRIRASLPSLTGLAHAGLPK